MPFTAVRPVYRLTPWWASLSAWGCSIGLAHSQAIVRVDMDRNAVKPASNASASDTDAFADIELREVATTNQGLAIRREKLIAPAIERQRGVRAEIQISVYRVCVTHNEHPKRRWSAAEDILSSTVLFQLRERT